MSESHFMSLFKRVTGLSFVTYFNHFRIERAQALLAKTEESMASISQQVGFCDQSYFGTVFRRIVGMTPANYRRRIRNNSLTTSASLATCRDCMRKAPAAWIDRGLWLSRGRKPRRFTPFPSVRHCGITPSTKP